MKTPLINWKTIFLNFSLFTFIFFANNSFGQAHTFATFNPGILTSGTAGVTNTMATSGLSGGYFVFYIKADFTGSGMANTAWSNSIQVEVNNGGSVIYKDLSQANYGFFSDPTPTTLYWTGIFNLEYGAPGTLNVRFFDDYHDASGPYICTISNVQMTISPLDPAVIITGGGATSVSGTYPNFTVTSTDTQLSEMQVDNFVANNGFITSEVDGDIMNEIQDLSLSMNTLSLSSDATPVDLSSYLDDTVLTEMQVDNFVSNNGFLTEESWTSSGDDISYSDGKVGIGTATPAFELDVAGNVNVTGELTAASDFRIKKDVASIEFALEKLQNLNPVSYNFKYTEYPQLNLSKNRKMGLIAQEVESSFPNLVSLSSTIKDTNGFDIQLKSVNYIELIPLLIASIQELEREVEKKDSEIKKLSGLNNRIAELESKMASFLKSSNSEIE